MDFMTVPIIEKRSGANGEETWVQFQPDTKAILVHKHHWIGFDFDGVLSQPDRTKPYSLQDLGLPINEMVEIAKMFIEAGVSIRVFTARASEAHMIPKIQQWTQQYGLGMLTITNTKDYGMLRFYDDRAIQIMSVWLE